MKLIKDIWIIDKWLKRNYRYGLFICDNCWKEIEKILKDWVKAKWCSHNCYKVNRKMRWPYKEKIMINKYIYVYNPTHPNTIWTRKLYIAKHRLIMEQYLWRYLTDNEIVHHLNEDTLDNRLENLEIMTNSEHMILHSNIKKRDENWKFTK